MGSPGLQRSHGTELILSLPPYLLLGSFFVLVVVPVSWESVSLLGRVPTAGAVCPSAAGSLDIREGGCS